MLNGRIKQLSTERGITQVELAKKLNVSKQAVSNWENDNIQPSIEILMKLSDYFSVSCDYLLGLDDKKYLEISGLTAEETSHVQQIINDIRKK